jgi:hypothetical protein
LPWAVALAPQCCVKHRDAHKRSSHGHTFLPPGIPPPLLSLRQPWPALPATHLESDHGSSVDLGAAGRQDAPKPRGGHHRAGAKAQAKAKDHHAAATSAIYREVRAPWDRPHARTMNAQAWLLWLVCCGRLVDGGRVGLGAHCLGGHWRPRGLLETS